MPSSPEPAVDLTESLIESRTLLEGGFLEVRKDLVRLPDGKSATREYIVHPGAVAVIPLLDDGRAVTVRQYRYPLGQLLLEYPAGKRDPGEEAWACAMRELTEETGYTARQWARGGMFHNAAAYATERIEIWFARGLEPGPQRLDEGEFVEVLEFGLDELESLAMQGELTDAKTLIGTQWWRLWREGRWPLHWQDAADLCGP